MILRRQCLLWGVGVWAVPAAASVAGPQPGLADQVRARLVAAPVLRGRFEQRKTVQGFKNPLVSQGEFLVAQARGVVWHTRSPFESTLVVTRDRLLTQQADGRVGTRLDARDEPGLRAVNEMLFALLGTDLDLLAQRFDVSGELKGRDAWRLLLVPRDAALAQWLTRIELEGDRHVRQVRLQEAQGDVSVIRFSEHTTADALSAAEAVRLD